VTSDNSLSLILRRLDEIELITLRSRNISGKFELSGFVRIPYEGANSDEKQITVSKCKTTTKTCEQGKPDQFPQARRHSDTASGLNCASN
jgi:hypothetical protein